jgi:hypothetical protein
VVITKEKGEEAMKKVLFVLMFAILAMGFATCKGTLKVNAPEEEGEYTLFYNWTLPDSDSSPCIAGTPCKTKMWNPTLAGNEGIYRNLPLAAAMAGFRVAYVEKFTSDDVENFPYIMVVYTKEGIGKNTVTFIVNDGDLLEQVDVRKGFSENWLAFYTRGFKELAAKIPDPTTGKKPPKPPAPPKDDSDTNTADAGPPPPPPPPEKPKPPTAEEIEQARVACVAKINEFRKTLKLAALERDKANEGCTDKQAQKDQKANKAHENAEMCRSTSAKYAQNTCPGYGSLADANGVCLQMMFDEGPPPTARCTGKCDEAHGHYIHITSKDFKKVSCGFSINDKGEVWANHNFSN